MGGKGLGSRPISNILRKRVEIGRREEVIGGGIEMQLFKTAITEMKERGLNRDRPPGARGIFDRVSQLEKFSKGFSSGPTSSNANQKSNVEFFFCWFFLSFVFLVGCRVAHALTRMFFPIFLRFVSKIWRREENGWKICMYGMNDPFDSSNEFNNDC